MADDASLNAVVNTVNDMLSAYKRNELAVGIEEFQEQLLDFIQKHGQSYKDNFIPERTGVSNKNRENFGLIPADVHRSCELAPSGQIVLVQSAYFVWKI